MISLAHAKCGMNARQVAMLGFFGMSERFCRDTVLPPLAWYSFVELVLQALALSFAFGR